MVSASVVESRIAAHPRNRLAAHRLLVASAPAHALLEIEPTLAITTIADRFRPGLAVGDAVFCAVDSIAARTAIWRAIGAQTRFWADGRLRGEVLRLLTATDEPSRRHYATTLFPQADAQPGPCTAKSTLYAATIAAGLLVHQFTRWLRQLPGDPDADLRSGFSNVPTTRQRKCRYLPIMPVE